MRLDIVMVSRLGSGDGGREAWLRSFLNEFKRLDNGCVFNFFSLSSQGNNLLIEFRGKKLFGYHVEFAALFNRLPLFVSFILRMFFFQGFKRKESDFVLAVGGLEEALAVILSYSKPLYKGKKVLWLRTIYSKEKGYRLNRFTQKLLLGFELFIIKFFFDIVIANGEDTAAFYRRNGVECVVIPNAVDLDLWSSVSPSTTARTKVAFVGRLVDVKGINAFLDAIEYLEPSALTDVLEFHVVGDGPVAPRVRDLERRGLLQYHGALPHIEVPSFLSKIDCCVALTYLTDLMGGGGVSNALIEQMAAKKIIVAWDNDIFNHVLDPSIAYMVPQGDTLALSEIFMHICENREEAERLADAASQVSNNYSIEEHVASFLKALRSLKR